MLPDNPYKLDSVPISGSEKLQAESNLTTRAAYNIVSDTVTGLNVRKRDNKFQAVFIFGSVLLFATASAVLTVFNGQWKLPWYGGTLVGAFAGLVIGVLASGTILMFYRGMQTIFVLQINRATKIGQARRAHQMGKIVALSRYACRKYHLLGRCRF